VDSFISVFSIERLLSGKSYIFQLISKLILLHKNPYYQVRLLKVEKMYRLADWLIDNRKRGIFISYYHSVIKHCIKFMSIHMNYQHDWAILWQLSKSLDKCDGQSDYAAMFFKLDELTSLWNSSNSNLLILVEKL